MTLKTKTLPRPGRHRRPHALTSVHHVPLFAACSAKELSLIAGMADRVSFTAGRTLTVEGQPGREAFVITKGIVTVHRGDSLLARVGAGDIVGEIAVLDNGPRTATVVCETDVEAVVISQPNLGGIVEHIPSFARKLLYVLSGRLRDRSGAVGPR
jgi:CRP/FNR family cyclic AMP-dependent transcriptional regulator